MVNITLRSALKWVEVVTNSHCGSRVKTTKWEQLSEWSTSDGFVCSQTISIISWIIWHDLERWQHTVTVLLKSFLVRSKGSTRKTLWKLLYKFSWLVWRSEKTTNRYIFNRLRNCIVCQIRSHALLLDILQSAVYSSIANRSNKRNRSSQFLFF